MRGDTFSHLSFLSSQIYLQSTLSQEIVSRSPHYNQSYINRRASHYIIAGAYYDYNYNDGLYLNKNLTCDVVSSISVTEGCALLSSHWSIITFQSSDWLQQSL